ncbi:hypothetical protein [Actinokineospora cianjurensis]|uniref:hypothetical protein n=1 Tax=Actinokineospora cianjurensis TaxID=585224 RepID=UPI0011C3E4FC|nr:hypothetical protein [Actinokineospora cianjurensis]
MIHSDSLAKELSQVVKGVNTREKRPDVDPLDNLRWTLSQADGMNHQGPRLSVEISTPLTGIDMKRDQKFG